MALRTLCIWFCICCCCCVCAQQVEMIPVRLVEQLSEQDTLEPVQEGYPLIEVQFSIIVEEDPLATKEEWSQEDIKTTSAVDVSELLQRSSGVYVKGYGAGGLATVSLRGTGAGRSSTVWNGMPLIGSTLGLLDYSLLNVNLFESVQLSLGGRALDGSGAIGGGVYLNNNSTLNDNEFSVGLKTVLGSFNRFNQGLNYSVKSERWWASTRASWETSENDFTYQIREDLPEITNTNAARNQVALLQSIGYQINDKNNIAVHFWAQDNDREIPPTTVQTRSVASVEDKTIRLQGVWNQESNERLSWTTIAATSYNQNIYEDPINGIFGDNIFRQVYLKTEARYNTNHGTWLAGVSNRLSQAETENYNESIRQNQLAFFVNYFRTIQDWHVNISLREDIINENLSPITGQASLSRFLSEKRIMFNVNINKHFRAPALNDLYWAPGGDVNLVPENGWGQELTMEYIDHKKWRLGFTAYNTTIQNWIQWGRMDGSSFVSALNLPKVWSRGIEGFFNAVVGNRYRQFNLQMSYNYNPSTYQFSLLNPTIEESDQVYYTPLHQAVASLTWEKPQYSISYTHRFQSGVTTILDPLDGFHLGTLRARCAHKNANLFVEVNNLWNANYRLIERRAMPSRYINVGINFEITENLKNTK